MAFRGLDQLVESRIQGAIARGELDRLPGQGKPLKEDDLSGLSRDERMEVLLARCAGSAPEEVQLLREIADLREAIARAPAGPARQKLAQTLKDRTLRLTLLFEASGKHVLVGLLDGAARAGAKLAAGAGPEPRRPRSRDR
ncbi:hypothetical protein BE20_55055 [Sorangium cellulosum]|uniref:DnaJ homologue subfamily C member 28 conserved domain-containing protein n=1 Tax=Sorangium cellulosum TaxID=56 RepID=A0A150T7E3_SORCE|nr:hypothetical protein BE18_50990 [Sorangium cellulosum]KYG00635.1 hypothetical protein BE20_55055 [Sorangium cellulosum]